MKIDLQKKELLEDLAGYMKNFEFGLNNTANLLQGGKLEQAKNNIVQVVDGLTWIVQSVTILQNSLKIDISGAEPILFDITLSIENDDDTLTADLFKYELLPIITDWKKTMDCANVSSYV